jgi:uncharacterized protein (DUF952 family)
MLVLKIKSERAWTEARRKGSGEKRAVTRQTEPGD